MKAFLREFLITLVLALLIFFGVNATLQTFVVVGSSMEPSFFEGERLLVSKASYFFGEPKRGDVIVFEPPGQRNGDYIKRVIALPGDMVEINSGTVYVNGSPLEEPYIVHPPQYTCQEQEIDDNSYFVLGDNRSNSNDSHTGWLVPRENIVGKAWFSIWPPSSLGLVPDYSPL
jgi:signal peptidase I